MPIIKSAIKRDRQSKSHRTFNRAIKANVKKSMRSIIDPVQNSLKVETSTLSQAFSTIDKAVKKGILHKNTAARKKSRITKIFNQSLPQENTASKKTKAATKTSDTKVKKSSKASSATSKKTVSKK
jgi:small subunit ribosomal protein S20